MQYEQQIRDYPAIHSPNNLTDKLTQTRRKKRCSGTQITYYKHEKQDRAKHKLLQQRLLDIYLTKLKYAPTNVNCTNSDTKCLCNASSCDLNKLPHTITQSGEDEGFAAFFL